jgi:hypothetical protein
MVLSVILEARQGLEGEPFDDRLPHALRVMGAGNAADRADPLRQGEAGPSLDDAAVLDAQQFVIVAEESRIERHAGHCRIRRAAEPRLDGDELAIAGHAHGLDLQPGMGIAQDKEIPHDVLEAPFGLLEPVVLDEVRSGNCPQERWIARLQQVIDGRVEVVDRVDLPRGKDGGWGVRPDVQLSQLPDDHSGE